MTHQTYTKINSIYKRYRDDDPRKKGLMKVGDYSTPEIEYLAPLKWRWWEKIDGTNIGVYWNGKDLSFHGKSDKAQIPKELQTVLESIIDRKKLEEIFPYDENKPDSVVRIYGEGYGGSIQSKAGKHYGKCTFRVFDIKVDGIWLEQDNVKDISQKLGLETAPFFGVMTVPEAEDVVRNGFKSRVSEDKDFLAEGLVGRPMLDMLDRRGHRIMVKVKTCDYQKLAKSVQ